MANREHEDRDRDRWPRDQRGDDRRFQGDGGEGGRQWSQFDDRSGGHDRREQWVGSGSGQGGYGGQGFSRGGMSQGGGAYGRGGGEASSLGRGSMGGVNFRDEPSGRQGPADVGYDNFGGGAFRQGAEFAAAQSGHGQGFGQGGGQGGSQGYGQGAGQGFGQGGGPGMGPGPRRGMGPRNYVRSDARIEEDVNEHLSHGHLDATDVEVKVEGGEVTLSGTVRSRGDKRLAEDIAHDVSGVRHVQNNLRVQDNWTGGGMVPGMGGGQGVPRGAPQGAPQGASMGSVVGATGSASNVTTGQDAGQMAGQSSGQAGAESGSQGTSQAGSQSSKPEPNRF